MNAGGEPVAGALVSIRRIDATRVAAPSFASGVSSAEGEFVLTGLDARALVLVVRQVGFGRVVQSVDQVAGDVDLGDVVLPRPCTLRGTVTDVDGAPLARILVAITSSEDMATTKLRSLQRWTDDLGRFCFPDLEAGSFDVRVGSVPDPIVRRQVELSLDQPIADLQLAPETTRSVVVRVVDQAGQPAVGVALRTHCAKPPDNKQGTTDETGHVVFELSHRPYELTVIPLLGLPFLRPEPIQIDAREARVDVTLERLVPIRGRLVLPDDQPVKRGFIRVEGSGPDSTSVFTGDDGAFVAHASAGARVSLHFEGIYQDGETRKHVFLPYAAHLDDVRAGAEGVVLRGTPLDTDRELAVRVLDPHGTPIEGVLLAVSLPVGEGPLTRTGSDGRVRWMDLPAVPVTPRIGGWRGATREQPWIEPRLERATPDGQELTARFRMGVPLEGRVEAEDGSPLRTGVVQVVEGETPARTAITDQDGRFVAILDPEFQGRVRLRVQAAPIGGHERFEAVLDVQPGQRPVTLRLARTK
ncbi:MAG: carboxypeptidase-like regulatory domain-containing protein [Planctomycetota bacterium]